MQVARTAALGRQFSSSSSSTAAVPALVSQASSALQSDLVQRSLAVEQLGGRSSVSGIRATVFGGSGFLGKYVINRLGKCGSQVVIPYRGDGMEIRNLKMMGDLGQILPTQFHLRDKQTVEDCCAESNVVVNCIGRDWQTNNFSYHDVHVHGARVIAESAKEQGVDRFVHVSAMGAAEDSKSEFLATKWEAEQVVKEIYPDATIIRPAHIYGMEDRFVQKVARFADLCDKFPLVYSGETRFSPVHVHDVADGIMTCIKNPLTTAGQTYELAGNDVVSFKEIVAMVQEKMNLPQHTREIPEPIAMLVSGIWEKWPFFHKPIMQDQIKQLQYDYIKSPESLGFDDLMMEPRKFDESVNSQIEMWSGIGVVKPYRTGSESAISIH